MVRSRPLSPVSAGQEAKDGVEEGGVQCEPRCLVGEFRGQGEVGVEQAVLFRHAVYSSHAVEVEGVRHGVGFGGRPGAQVKGGPGQAGPEQGAGVARPGAVLVAGLPAVDGDRAQSVPARGIDVDAELEVAVFGHGQRRMDDDLFDGAAARLGAGVDQQVEEYGGRNGAGGGVEEPAEGRAGRAAR